MIVLLLVRTRSSVVALTAALLLPFTCVVNAAHPLDPLSEGELATIRTVLMQSGRFSDGTKFEWVQLEEPPKQVVKNFQPNANYLRSASVIAIDYANRKSFHVTIDLNRKAIASLSEIERSQPGIAPSEAELVRTIVDSDPQIKSALIKRGLNIPGKVYDSVRVMYFPIGHDPDLSKEQGRLVRVLFASDQFGVNDFSPFLDGLMAVVDLYSKRVINLYDNQKAASTTVPHDVFSVGPPPDESP